ncbi:FtsX-like permease family protein [Arthrobacter sp. ok362]|uniref:FtsX-like permease family protein n=1 Tax=Arthrobacter sp. ok362 TaxID=1761745 RepID=UPI00088F8080|nr:FtsX-like permease family protein [Arthrobacter sp. ok362]SDL65025.1 FtsX-like permease family protein [Arthrobacter sp. ok362]
MNPAVLKMALLGSRSSWGRMAGIGGGVAIGVCLVLLLWSAANGLAQRDARGAWLREMGQTPVTVPLAADGLTANGRPEPIPLAPDKILLGFPGDIFRDQLINHRDIAALPTTTVKIPGIGAPPAPGQYYASPALQRLIESTPAEELGDRYGQFAGVIDDSALPGPDALVVITGVSEAQLRQGPAAMLVTDFTPNPYGESASLYRTALMVGGIAVLFPVLLLVSIATGLGAAQRRERFATLRLIGASPRLISGMAAVETAIPSLAGALLGVVLAVVFRPAAAQVPVDGTRVFLADFTFGAGFAGTAVVLVVAACALVAARRNARTGIGPLGVTRAMHEKTPTLWRAGPLLAGLAGMAFGAVLAKVDTDGNPWTSPLLIGGFALTAVGVVTVGPWLTRMVSTIGLHRARSAAAVIAASRIRQTPVATFRSVSGLVIAAFMVSVFAGGVSAIETIDAPEARPGLLLPTSVYALVAPGFTPGHVSSVAQNIQEVAGIRDVTVGYARAALGRGEDMDIYIPAEDAPSLGFRETLAEQVAAFDTSFLNSWTTTPVALTAAPVHSLAGLAPVVLVVGTDGTAEALDRARTALNTSGVTATPATSRADLATMGSTRLIQGLSALAYLGVFVAVVIAGISLAASTAAAILDRKRVLGLMRLMGMPVAVLRRVIVREAAVPLLAVLLLSVGLGFLVAWLMIISFGRGRTITWPGPEYYAALSLSLLLALAAVAATFGLVRSNTAITATRSE